MNSGGALRTLRSATVGEGETEEHARDEPAVLHVVRVGRDLAPELVLGLAEVERPEQARDVDEERLVRKVVPRANAVGTCQPPVHSGNGRGDWD